VIFVAPGILFRGHDAFLKIVYGSNVAAVFIDEHTPAQPKRADERINNSIPACFDEIELRTPIRYAVDFLYQRGSLVVNLDYQFSRSCLPQPGSASTEVI